MLKIKKCFTSYLNEEGSLCVNFLSTYSSETLLKRFAGDELPLFRIHSLLTVYHAIDRSMIANQISEFKIVG